MQKWLKKAAPIVLAVSLLTGCSFGGDKEGKAKEQSTLKVMYYDESSFFREYGMLFSAIYPEVDIQVVETSSLYRSGNEGEEVDREKLQQEFIEKEKPDLLMLDIKDYEKMAEEGKLYDLDTYVVKDKFNTEGLIPGMVDYMKELGGGQLYGMPSSVSSQVLYYNKALFDKYGVPHPTDQMNWADVIGLARQFPTDGEPADRVYGLKVGYSGALSDFSTMLADSEGLKYVDPKTKKMTINTPGWATSVQTALDAIKSKALYFEDPNNSMNGGSYEDYLLKNPFISGRLAMTIDGTYFMNEIKEATNYIKEEGAVVKDWDMVTVPVSAQLPDESSSAYYSSIFSIAKDSPNADAAWKFISYISSEEYARVKAKMIDYSGLPIHTKYIKDDEGRNFAAFYKLKPSRNNQYSDFDKLPPQFGMMFHDIMNKEFKEIQDGKKEIEESLEYLQVKGDELLAQEPMTDKEMNEMMQKQMEESQN
ncbi:extracellular solute-binding protein [Paenibacillus sp. GSMTC-2017]|uniref:ABC transporter substrate-binding protein n=1 Tax=Paenibacillus sp. GSMTC-2017 TaxID=2794350 RepID=UPI0018D677D1|nr:extracellular solute-binding protein [Paenibacillus sp. GSMTC-2017]MBH5319991.1 extracellular solute-binding protein [Paenibacillus sp. GSMTC-2017]